MAIPGFAMLPLDVSPEDAENTPPFDDEPLAKRPDVSPLWAPAPARTHAGGRLKVLGLRNLLPHWDELPPPQQNFVQRHLQAAVDNGQIPPQEGQTQTWKWHSEDVGLPAVRGCLSEIEFLLNPAKTGASKAARVEFDVAAQAPPLFAEYAVEDANEGDIRTKQRARAELDVADQRFTARMAAKGKAKAEGQGGAAASVLSLKTISAVPKESHASKSRKPSICPPALGGSLRHSVGEAHRDKGKAATKDTLDPIWWRCEVPGCKHTLLRADKNRSAYKYQHLKRHALKGDRACTSQSAAVAQYLKRQDNPKKRTKGVPQTADPPASRERAIVAFSSAPASAGSYAYKKRSRPSSIEQPEAQASAKKPKQASTSSSSGSRARVVLSLGGATSPLVAPKTTATKNPAAVASKTAVARTSPAAASKTAAAAVASTPPATAAKAKPPAAASATSVRNLSVAARLKKKVQQRVRRRAVALANKKPIKGTHKVAHKQSNCIGVHWDKSHRNWVSMISCGTKTVKKSFSPRTFLKFGLTEKAADKEAMEAAVKFRKKIEKSELGATCRTGEKSWLNMQQDAVTSQVKSRRKIPVPTRGVNWYTSTNRWHAWIGFKGKRIHGGYFPPANDTIKAKEEARQRAVARRRELEEKFYRPIDHKKHSKVRGIKATTATRPVATLKDPTKARKR